MSKTAADYLPEQREVLTCNFPGTERVVGVLLLSCAEVQDAAFAAREHFVRRRQDIAGVMGELFQFEWEYQLVFRMLIDPDSRRESDRVFASVEQLRAKLHPDHVQFFLNQHHGLRARYAEQLGITVDDGD